MRLRGVLFLLLCCLNQQLAIAASGQESVQSLPDAPVPAGTADNSTAAEGSASVSGTVLDVSGAAVSGATVILMQMGEGQQRTIRSGADGGLAFSRISPGSYVVVAAAPAFQQSASAEFILAARQAYQVPSLVLPIAEATTEVVVRPTEVIAAEQMKAEETQRVLGIIPNFYTSYVWDAAPLNAKQKYSMAMRETFDPVSFIAVSITAGVEQASNAFPGYGQGAQGYGKRWAARFVDGRTSDLLSHAVFPALFHQDPRYFYQGSGTKRSRVSHAVSSAFIARSDSGRTMPNYSYLLGDICSGALSNAYYPASSRGANLVFTNAAIGLAGRAGANIILEFFSKRITRNARGDGKPAPISSAP